MIRFSIYRLLPSHQVARICTVERSTIYCSEALHTSINEGWVVSPGRYLVVRHGESSTWEPSTWGINEIQQFDVDVSKAPLKILPALLDKPPS